MRFFYSIILSLFFTLAVFPQNFYLQDSVKQGHPLTFVVSPVDDHIQFNFILKNKKGRDILNIKGFNYYMYEIGSNIVVGLGGIPSSLKPGVYKVEAIGESLMESYFFERSITVLDAKYKKMELIASKQMTDINNGEIDEERVDQSKRLWTAISDFNQYILYEKGKLLLPVDGRHTSPFGFERITKYQDGKESVSIHKGEDLAIEEGTPVYSDGEGVVLLAENRIVTGNTIVVQHLPGVVTIYYHMESLNCTYGDRIRKGDIIGYVGSTGFSTGPHLHWEIRFATVPVNPMLFLDRPLLDKSHILNMISNTNTKKGG